MEIATRPTAPQGTSLKSLINGFVLTKQTEGKSPRTVEFYAENLKRFLWYTQQKEWPDDIRAITEWDRETPELLLNSHKVNGIEPLFCLISVPKLLSVCILIRIIYIAKWHKSRFFMVKRHNHYMVTMRSITPTITKIDSLLNY